MSDQLPVGVDGLPKVSAAEAAEAAKRTADKWTNAPGVTDVSAMGGQVNSKNVMDPQGGFRGIDVAPRVQSAPAPPVAPKAPVVPSEDGGKIVPTDMYLDEKKKWQKEKDDLKGEVDTLKRGMDTLAYSVINQPAATAPPPPPEEEPIQYEPVLDADGNVDPLYTAIMDRMDKRDNALLKKVVGVVKKPFEDLQGASAKQAVQMMLDKFYARTGIDPSSDTGKMAGEGITALIGTLPVNMKERSADIWLDRHEKAKAEWARGVETKNLKVKEDATKKNEANLPGGLPAGEIPPEYLDRSKGTAKQRAEAWLRMREGQPH